MSTYFVRVKKTIIKYKTFEVEAESQDDAQDQVAEILENNVSDEGFGLDSSEYEIIEESE